MAAIVLATINAKWIHPSLALRLLKANLGDLESRCTIMEFALRQPLAEKTAPILAAAPRILGLSVSIWNHGASMDLLRKLEETWRGSAFSRPVIVLGGPEITSLSPGAEILGFADFVIRGEGELVFAELCRAVLEDFSKAKRRYRKYIEAGHVNLAALKPGYSLYSAEDLRYRLIYTESSRGCPHTCAFCQSAAENGGTREFPLETFLADLGDLLERTGGVKNKSAPNAGALGTGTMDPVSVRTAHFPRTIKFLDRSFNVNIPRALRILEFCLLQVKAVPALPVQFHFEMVPRIFPRELRLMLARFPPGSLRLEIGIQSFNPRTCALIHRASNPEGELEILRFLRTETSALVHADLIAGLPGEDLDSFGNGFDRLWLALTGSGERKDAAPEDGPLESSAPWEIQPGILKCLPGTPLYFRADTLKLRFSGAAPYEIIETDCLSAVEMEKIKNFARFWELIVNRRAFPDLLPPPGGPVFRRFMELSQKLFDRFGRNWGIPKNELREALENLLD
ncbi:MAG: B12-binding domain-containing radical SAM protein [Treponema sp.]|jgi:radical SAM superfamily enzyme YgiQ (UPF0313 family)|nr:B12-binding domain-containing radical SAM protein [Treponema sp.]